MANLTDAVRAGRRACCWHWYLNSRRPGSGLTQASNKGYRGIQGYPHEGWEVRVSFPRKPYCIAVGRTHYPRKIHMVKDQLVATHKRLPEARMTRYLCGAHTFQAELLWSADEVCTLCLIRYEKRSTEPI